MSNPNVLIVTSMGEMLVELYADKAPETVANFLSYVDEEFYDGLIFHRVIKNFMIQGGGMDMMMREKKNKAPIKNEASAELPNLAFTLAMARTMEPHSAHQELHGPRRRAPGSHLDHQHPPLRSVAGRFPATKNGASTWARRFSSPCRALTGTAPRPATGPQQGRSAAARSRQPLSDGSPLSCAFASVACGWALS